MANKKEVKLIPDVSPTLCYYECLNMIRHHLEVDLVLDPFAGSEFCFHKIYKLAKPVGEKGINYPSKFGYWKLLPREDLASLEEEYIRVYREDIDSGNDIVKEEQDWTFLSPVFTADANEKQVKLVNNIVKRLLNLEPEKSSQRGICIKPGSLKRNEYPRAFLPEDSWFNKKLLDLKIEDILTILPKAEQEIYALSIGRVVVGATGTKHIGTDLDIKHSWRTAPVITGLPGIGKSTLTMSLIDAIKTTGYHVSVFKDLGGRFGIGEIVTADLAYADDLNQETFQKYIKSPVVKQAITGGEIKTEKKFLDEVTTKPNACFISNINDFNIACTYGTDDGVLDRLKILNTHMPTQLLSLQSNFTGVSRYSPNLHPIPHFEFLCDKFDCSQNALFLRFAKLCADLFVKKMKDDTLNSEINRLSTKLEIQLHKHYDKVMAMVFQLSYLICSEEEIHILPDLKPTLLGEAIQNLNCLVNDKNFHEIREIIKEDWKSKDRPSYHPWTGIKLFDQISVENAAIGYQEIQHNFADKDLDKCIKTIFTALRLNQGYNVPANTAQVIQSWEGSKKQLSSLIYLNKVIRESVKPAFFNMIHRPNYTPDTKHIRTVNYDRQKFSDEINKDISKGLSPSIKVKK